MYMCVWVGVCGWVCVYIYTYSFSFEDLARGAFIMYMCVCVCVCVCIIYLSIYLPIYLSICIIYQIALLAWYQMSSSIIAKEGNHWMHQGSCLYLALFWKLSSIYFVLKTMCYCCLAAKTYLALLWPMDCSPTGSSVCGISQARILEWVAISFSRGFSWLRDPAHVPCFDRQIFYHCTREAPYRQWRIVKRIYLNKCLMIRFEFLVKSLWE